MLFSPWKGIPGTSCAKNSPKSRFWKQIVRPKGTSSPAALEHFCVHVFVRTLFMALLLYLTQWKEAEKGESRFRLVRFSDSSAEWQNCTEVSLFEKICEMRNSCQINTFLNSGTVSKSWLDIKSLQPLSIYSIFYRGCLPFTLCKAILKIVSSQWRWSITPCLIFNPRWLKHLSGWLNVDRAVQQGERKWRERRRGMQILPGVMALRRPESHLDMMSITQQQAHVCVCVR